MRAEKDLIVAAAALAGAKSLITENRKTLNNPKVKEAFQRVNTKSSLKELKIRDCKSFMEEIYV